MHFVVVNSAYFFVPFIFWIWLFAISNQLLLVGLYLLLVVLDSSTLLCYFILHIQHNLLLLNAILTLILWSFLLGRLRSSHILKNIISVLLLGEVLLVLKYLVLLMVWHYLISSIRLLRNRSHHSNRVKAVSKLILIFRKHFLLEWRLLLLLTVKNLSVQSASDVSCRGGSYCLKALIRVNIFSFLRIGLFDRRVLTVDRLNTGKGNSIIIFLQLYRSANQSVGGIVLVLNNQIIIVLGLSSDANIIGLIQKLIGLGCLDSGVISNWYWGHIFIIIFLLLLDDCLLIHDMVWLAQEDGHWAWVL